MTPKLDYSKRFRKPRAFGDSLEVSRYLGEQEDGERQQGKRKGKEGLQRPDVALSLLLPPFGPIP